jgi:hypothetical protein
MQATETLGRKWIAVESELHYVIGSAFRFMQDWPDEEVAEFMPGPKARPIPARGIALVVLHITWLVLVNWGRWGMMARRHLWRTEA